MGPSDVLSFWFGDVDAASYPAPQPKLWWSGDAEVDARVRERFGATLDAAAAGALADWDATPRGLLAHVIVLDQLTRNAYRGTARMYALDDEAQDLTLRALRRGDELALHPEERGFLIMPLMHAENVALQRLCVRLFEELRDAARPVDRQGADGRVVFALRHLRVVERFGRFPHRNGILGRTTTEEEAAFLATTPHGF